MESVLKNFLALSAAFSSRYEKSQEFDSQVPPGVRKIGGPPEGTFTRERALVIDLGPLVPIACASVQE